LGVALRPHAKTHKCSAIARRQVEAGAIGIACATIDEAQVMVEADLPGVLVTSPRATDHKVRRLTELLHRRPDLAVVADHPQHVGLLAETARRYSVAPSVLVDLDVGDHRTGTATLEAEIGSDLIVLKTHGRHGISHLILGNVAEEVVRSAPCAVLSLTPTACGRRLAGSSSS
jgi:D-serine deaminase-like pyridoxal phosphate-dependent protein